MDGKQDIIEFLDTRRKDTTIDPDQKWFRTWNDYLQRIKYFMGWLHNDRFKKGNEVIIEITPKSFSTWDYSKMNLGN